MKCKKLLLQCRDLRLKRVGLILALLIFRVANLTIPVIDPRKERLHGVVVFLGEGIKLVIMATSAAKRDA